MNTLTISKKEIAYLLAATAIIPVACFVAGFNMQPTMPAPATTATVTTEKVPTALVQHSSAVQSLETTISLPNAEEPRSDTNRIIRVIESQEDSENLPAALPLPVTPESTVNADQLQVPSKPIESFIVQAGLFASTQNAEIFAARLAQSGIEAQILHDQHGQKARHRVIVGLFPTKDEATAYMQSFKKTHPIQLYIATYHPVESVNLLAGL